MQDFLECPICLDAAIDAVESDCCNKIFCEKCVQSHIGSKCPLCRKSPLKTKPSVLARRMIGTLPVECPYECDAKLTRDRLAFHLENCPNRVMECSSSNCNFKGKLSEYLQHITKTHAEDIIRSFDYYNNKKQNNKNNDDEKKAANDQQDAMKEDPVATRKNSRGAKARLGSTGKYYCRQRHLTGCSCCNGNCGPTNGCNCVSCMELDVRSRKLAKGYLVNRDGATARISAETGRFYCGRKTEDLARTRGCDGYCGPTNGPNCNACTKLDKQANTRYKQLM